MYIYEVINGQAININPGPSLEGTFNTPYVSWDGNPANEPKERLHPPRGFKRSDYQSSAAKTSTPKKSVVVNLEKLDDLNIDDSLFESMETGTIFDKFCSSEGGIQRGTNVMAVGAPGIGKTTVLLELLSKLHEAGRRVLFISAEMNQIDMARYLKRFPNWGQLPILFLGDYSDSDPKTVIEQTINQGWDLVLTDSYTEVNDTVKEESNMTRGKVEKWFLNLMSENNKGKNANKSYTTFITILQMSKGGTFVGSNKLKHNTTSMMTLQWDGGENSGKRYMEFSKNRVGQVGKKLYFSLDNGVNFDEARYARSLFNDEIVADERKQLETEAMAFDRLFGFSEIEEAVEVNETESLEMV
jgi:predicted ATP-dependent serine protease